MKKTIIINSTIVAIAIATIVCFVFLFPKRKEISPKELYSDSLQSVVEVKAMSENVGESFGTAEFITEDGLLITNAHVITYSKMGDVNAFDEIFIRFATQDEYIKVELVRYDTNLDLAILRLADASAYEFTPVKFARSSEIVSGETVYAIGNLLNYGISISEGIVGVPLVEIEYSGNSRKVIQCDLTIAEGNSGGGLFNSYGEFLGITTFRTKDKAGNTVYGIAYSIPSDVITEYINQ